MVHAVVLGTALIGFAWPEPEDAPAPGAVTVDLIALSTISNNVQSTLQTSTSLDLVSAGSEVVQPTFSQTLDSAEPNMVEAVAAAPIEALTSSAPVLAIKPEPAASPIIAALTDVVLTDMIQSTSPAVLPASSVETIEPVDVSDAKVAPVPLTLSFARPSQPTARPAQQPQPSPKSAATPPASQLGNGGSSNSDTAASAATAGNSGSTGTGGSAETARWQNQVQRRLANALRYPRSAGGARGDVLVRFTLAADGSASSVRIVQSSGNPVLDQAGLETVSRAAPFPPIPAEAGAQTWVFTFPLSFVR